MEGLLLLLFSPLNKAPPMDSPASALPPKTPLHTGTTFPLMEPLVSGLSVTKLSYRLLTAAGGKWEDQQILSSAWIERATAVHVNREKPTQYGYYWWSHEVEHGGRTYRVRSCRGAGGQFIMVLPELQLVAVFTSYYADNKPLQHLERVILPAFAQD